MGDAVGPGLPLGSALDEADGASVAVGSAVGNGEVTGIGSGATATGTLTLGTAAPPLMASTPALFS